MGEGGGVENGEKNDHVISEQPLIENFTDRYEFDHWKMDIDWDLFVIAGGSLLSSLLVQPPTKNGYDVDLFFLKENSRSFERAVVRVKIVCYLYQF